jgi:uncharacterized membrane protein
VGYCGGMQRLPLREYLVSRLWFVPLLCVIGGVLLSVVTLWLDRQLGDGTVPRELTGDPDGAFVILATIATSMVTLTTLVLTVTMVVVQLAMQQFSPRVLRTILRDRPSQAAVGVFVATFAQAMIVLPQVQAASGSDPGYVPGVSIVVSYVLVLVSIMVLVTYVNHIGMSMRAAALIDSVGDEMDDLVDDLYPPAAIDAGEPRWPEGDHVRVIATPDEGVLYRVNGEPLIELARRWDAVCVVVPRLGDYVARGAPLIELHGGGGDAPEDPFRREVMLGPERTLDADLAYGLRMLVDVAVKSASDAFADPTTAVQAIDRIHSSLRQLATRPFPSGQHVDEDRVVRLVVPQLDWDGYVHLACDELRQLAPGSIQLTRRLGGMLDDLTAVAPPDRRPSLERQRQMLTRGAERSFEEDDDIAFAIEGDQQGIGSAPSITRRASTH